MALLPALGALLPPAMGGRLALGSKRKLEAFFFFPHFASSKWVKVHLSSVCGNSASLCLKEAASVPIPRPPSFPSEQASFVCEGPGTCREKRGA